MKPLHLPRVVDILFVLAFLYIVDREAPRILPAVLGLLVLYALLTNVPRFTALLDTGNGSLARAFGRPRKAS